MLDREVVRVTTVEYLLASLVAQRGVKFFVDRGRRHGDRAIIASVRPDVARALGYRDARYLPHAVKAEVVTLIERTIEALRNPRVHPGEELPRVDNRRPTV